MSCRGRVWRPVVRLLVATSIVALASSATSGASTAFTRRGIDYAAYKGLPAVYRVMAWIRAGESTAVVPANLIPKLAAEGGGTYGSCSAATGPDCPTFGDPRSRTKMVIVGDSFAGEWLPALNLLGKEDDFGVVSYARAGCNIASAVVRAFSGSVDPQCATFRAQVIRAINTMRPQPSLVVISEARYWTWPDGKEVTDPQWARAIRTTLASLRTTHKEVLFGEALASNVPAECLAAHLTTATACADPVRKDVYSAAQFGVPGIVAGGAYPVGATVLMCGTTCPLIADDTLVHSDPSHVNRDFSALVAGALGALLGCGTYSSVSDVVTTRLLGAPNAAKKASCARLLQGAGWP
jgi:SGNH domain (fused to AT3 domains)